MKGRYDAADRSLNLVPGEWLERPSGWRAMSLTGALSNNGRTMSGSVGGCGGAPGDNTFSAQRMGSDGVAGSPARVMADRSSPPSGGAFEGHWRGHIACDAGRIETSFDILQDESSLVGLARLTVPDGSAESRQVLAGDIASGAGAARLESTINLNANRNRRFLTFDQVSGLRVEGGRLLGEIVRLAAPPRWRNCSQLVLTRAGAPRTPNLANNPAAGQLAGTWVGFDSYAKTLDETRKADLIADVGQHGVPQARLDVVATGGRAFATLAIAGRSHNAPADQPRSVMTLRPLLQLDDGRIGLVRQRVSRADRDVSEHLRTSDILAISRDRDGALLLERTTTPGRGGSFLRLLAPSSKEALAAMNNGEGPPLPLPAAFAGAFAQAGTLDAQCRAVRDWMSPVIGATDFGRLTEERGVSLFLPLLDDRVFEAAFGMPYGLTTLSERRVLSFLAGAICPGRVGYNANVRHVVASVFGEDRKFNLVVGRLADRRESRSWHQEAIAEIAGLPDAAASVASLDTIERTSRTRASELSPEDRAKLDEAISAKRSAIALVEIKAGVESAVRLPDNRETLGALIRLADRLRPSKVAAAEGDRLRQELRTKAGAIVSRLSDAALATAQREPKTLDGLANVTSLYRDMARLTGELPADFGAAASDQRTKAIRTLREGLIGEPAVVEAFRSSLAALPPGDGEAEAAVTSFASRYLDPPHYSGSSANRAYAEAVRLAIEDLDIRSIDFVDRSTGSVPNEPTAREMMLAVKGFFDRASANLKATYTRCQNRQYGNDPLAAMECIAILGAGGGQAFSLRMTRFEKIGCGAGSIQSGHVCDYVLGFTSTSPMMRGRMAEIMGAGSLAQARFVRTTQGIQFIPLRQGGAAVGR